MVLMRFYELSRCRAAMTRHGRRTGPGLDHIDKARSAKNRFGSDWSDDASNLRDCMQRVMQHHNATLRKNAPVGSHLLLTASAGYFRPGRPNELGTWDQHRLDSWLNANLPWVSADGRGRFHDAPQALFGLF